MFVRNMRYIVSQLGLYRGKDYSLTDLSNFFGIKRLTIHKWLTEKIKSPKKDSLELICAKLNSPPYGWHIYPNDLLKRDISNYYSLKNQKSDFDKNIKMMMHANLLDSKAICKRLKALRVDRGWTYLDVSKKINLLFSNIVDEQDYNVSHTHVRDIEQGFIKNFHVSKIIALASIYGVLLEYVLYGKTIPTKPTVDNRQNLLIIPLSKKITDFLSNENVLNHYIEEHLGFTKYLEGLIHEG